MLEYGGAIMRNVSKSQLGKLDVIYNKGLRICLGAFPTTPVKSLYSEAAVPSLNRRREKAANKFVIKVLGQREHFLKEMLENPMKNLNRKQAKRKNNNISTLRATYQKLEEMELSKIRESTTYLTVPKWLKNNIKIDISLHRCRKDELPEIEWQILVRNKESQYQDYPQRYTDGSKLEEKAGFAVVSKNENILCRRLPDGTSVFTAEQMAIYHAASDETIQDNKVAIFTDSLSSIMSLTSRDVNNSSTVFFLNQINKLEREVILIWIPSHKGIRGNDRADGEAKRGAEMPDEPEKIYNIADAMNILEKIEKDEISKEWLETENNFLRNIKSDYKRFKYPQEIKRKEERILTRLRLGQTKFTNEHVYYRLHNKMCEYCETEITVKHILEDCISPELARERKNYNISRETLKKTEKIVDMLKFLKKLKFDEVM